MTSKCQICGSPNALRFQKKINNKWVTLHLCKKCAIEQGIITVQKLSNKYPQPSLTLPHFCPYCGWTYKNFAHLGRFGCPECYKVFKSFMPHLLPQRTSKKTCYIGKQPNISKKSEFYRKILRLEKWIDLAINSENYEKAAKLQSERISTQNQSLN